MTILGLVETKQSLGARRVKTTRTYTRHPVCTDLVLILARTNSILEYLIKEKRALDLECVLLTAAPSSTLG